MNQKIDNPAKKTTLPKITLNSLAEKRGFQSDASKIGGENKSSSVRNFPIVPPKSESVLNSLPVINDETPIWFVVLSPRETRGPTGPFSINQLKQLYKREEVADRTLVWRDGEKEWKPLVQQTYLKAQLTSLPPIPPRVSNYNAELKLFQPFSKLANFTDPDNLPRFLPLPEKDKNVRTCCQCGALAVYHTEEQPTQVGDIFKGQQSEEIGSNEHATEVIPGFLWIGNINAARPASIQSLGITLLVNVSGYNGLIKSNPPYFRCKDVNTLRESYDDDEVNEKQRLDILETFEKIYDWVEYERTSSEKNRLSDAKIRSPRIQDTNQYGLPIRSADDKPFRRPEPDATTPFFPPRVLIWSKQGINRACVVAISYLIKQHGMSLPFAKRFLATLKPQMDIETAYIHLLALWSKKYSLGFLFCADCALMVEKKKDVNLQVQQITNEGIIEMKPNPDRPAEKDDSKTIEETIEDLSKTLKDMQVNTNIHQQHKIALLSEGSVASTSNVSQPPHLLQSQTIATSISSVQQRQEKDDLRSVVSTASGNSSKAAVTINPNPSIIQPPTPTNTAATPSSAAAIASSNAAALSVSVQLVDDIDKILPLTSFLKPLYTNVFFDTASSYGGLLDVNFQNQQLSDNTLSVILQLMENMTVLHQVRHLHLSDNAIKNIAMRTLLLAFYPKANCDPDSEAYLDDDPYYSDQSSSDEEGEGGFDEEDDDEDSFNGTSLLQQQEKRRKEKEKEKMNKKIPKIIPLKRIPNITILDLSHNRLDEQGVRYLTFFLQQSQSVISLNLFNNQLSDSFLAEILTAFITPTSQFGSDLASTSASFSKKGRDNDNNSQNSGSKKRQGEEKKIIQNNYFETNFFNQSVTDLNIGRNDLAAVASDVLQRVIKQNVVLTSLNIEGCQKLVPKTFKRITEAIRLYNPYLTRLNCDSLSLSVKACEYLGKIQGKSKVTRIRALSLARCSLTSLHITHLSKFLSQSKSIERLDISCNPLTDAAVPAIVDILLGQVGMKEATQAPPTTTAPPKAEEEEEEEVQGEGAGLDEGMSVGSPSTINTASLSSAVSSIFIVQAPPITYLDLTSCSLSAKGCTDVINALRQLGRPLQELLLSFNTITFNDVDFFVALSGAAVVRLSVSHCRLQSKGAIHLLHLLTPSCTSIRSSQSQQPAEGRRKKVMVSKPIAAELRQSLRYLNLSHNEISDSAGPALAQCIQENLLIEEIDLSFNQITEKHRELYQEAVKVTSSSAVLRKLDNLTIHLQGNPCNALMFDAPGMTRSKIRFTEGVAPNRFNSNRAGFDHIDTAARDAFFVRKDLQYMTEQQHIVYDEE